MTLFLTSDFNHYHMENGIKIPNEFDNTNHVVDHIKENLKDNKVMLYIASVPDNKEIVDEYSKLLFEGLRLSGISFDRYYVLDRRTYDKVSSYVKEADLIFLSGGDPYVQNKFFDEINLKELLSSYSGLIIGQSAGAINTADDVFNSPEEKDSLEPVYLKGLGLTDINIEPHFVFDDKDFTEDEKYQRKIVIEESYRRKLYGQCNGSHIVIYDNNEVIVYGKTYVIDNGEINLLCNDKENVMISRSEKIR